MSTSATPSFGEPGQTEPPLLDVLASNARTALTDPDGLPEPVASILAAAERRAVDPDDNPYADYAVTQLDELINALNPAEYDRASFAATLTMLGRHLAERADELVANATQAAETDAAADAEALQAAADLVQDACDKLDEAIETLVPDTDD